MTYWASLVAQMVNHLPAMQETGVWFLGWEGALEKEMATHSFSFLENPMDRGAWRATYSPWGHKELDRLRD